jgi:hypothetical protein
MPPESSFLSCLLPPVQACELLIADLTLKSWIEAKKQGKTTVGSDDLSAVISLNEEFDFLREGECV